MIKLATFLFFGFFLATCNESNSIELPVTDDANVRTFAVSDNNQKLSENDETTENVDNDENISKKLIKNGSVVFETEDLEKTKTDVTFLVKKYRGYITSDSKNEYDNRETYFLNIRVPEQYFDSILSGISSKVSKFESKEIRISDVTEEYLDIESRLKNKKELEKRYLEILQQAKTVENILNVERELGKIREEIESTEGRLIYLKNQVSFSTLSVSFYKLDSNEASFGSKIWKSFKNGFKNLQLFFIGVIAIWPFIILFVIGFIVVKKWRNRKK